MIEGRSHLKLLRQARPRIHHLIYIANLQEIFYHLNVILLEFGTQTFALDGLLNMSLNMTVIALFAAFAFVRTPFPT